MLGTDRSSSILDPPLFENKPVCAMLWTGQVVRVCFTRVSKSDRFFAGLYTKCNGHLMKSQFETFSKRTRERNRRRNRFVLDFIRNMAEQSVTVVLVVVFIPLKNLDGIYVYTRTAVLGICA